MQLENKFKLKDLGQLNYFLGIEVSKSPDGIFLSQRKYILEIFEESRLSRVKSSKILMEMHIDLRNDKSKPIDKSTTLHFRGKLIKQI